MRLRTQVARRDMGVDPAPQSPGHSARFDERIGSICQVRNHRIRHIERLRLEMEMNFGGKVAAQEKIGKRSVHQELCACIVGDDAEAATFVIQDVRPDRRRIVDQEIRSLLVRRSGGAQVCGYRVAQVGPVSPQAGMEQLLEAGLHVIG